MPASACNYRFGNKLVQIQIDDPRLHRFVSEKWARFKTEDTSERAPHATISIRQDKLGDVKRLGQFEQCFYDDEVTVVADAQKTFTCYFGRRPWSAFLTLKAGGDLSFAHYYVIEPLILYMLRRLNVLQLHAAVLERNGKGILIAGASGTGKSTASAALVGAGYSLLSDDRAFLAGAGAQMRLYADDPHISLSDESRKLFPHLGFLQPGKVRNAGKSGKRIYSPIRASKPSSGGVKPHVLIFTEPRSGTETTVRSMAKGEALARLLERKPIEYPVMLTDSAGLTNELELCGRLVANTATFAMNFAGKPEDLPSLIASLSKKKKRS